MIFKFKYFLGKPHVHIAVFDGPKEGRLQLSGRLVFAPVGWEAFKKAKPAEGDEFIFEEVEEAV